MPRVTGVLALTVAFVNVVKSHVCAEVGLTETVYAPACVSELLIVTSFRWKVAVPGAISNATWAGFAVRVATGEIFSVTGTSIVCVGTAAPIGVVMINFEL